ncbi:hypothetical protein H696_01962 [Fonticula alba]|uniref:Thioredoxin domain-containing protein n=1 Tax=Fonticula alba TaxID=691883 RepID=A0A058ZAQ0_FONAL|nr:hypothetical protein H696_01962 [Fonticula alba]KCV71016.1 hypothetical protein H696_01962 [Fonticula alba]|eukprot:XP_009494139.1 hypothetical protein H696_01962 [Fonticula alba]
MRHSQAHSLLLLVLALLAATCAAAGASASASATTSAGAPAEEPQFKLSQEFLDTFAMPEDNEAITKRRNKYFMDHSTLIESRAAFDDLVGASTAKLTAVSFYSGNCVACNHVHATLGAIAEHQAAQPATAGRIPIHRVFCPVHESQSAELTALCGEFRNRARNDNPDLVLFGPGGMHLGSVNETATAELISAHVAQTTVAPDQDNPADVAFSAAAPTVASFSANDLLRYLRYAAAAQGSSSGAAIAQAALADPAARRLLAGAGAALVQTEEELNRELRAFPVVVIIGAEDLDALEAVWPQTPATLRRFAERARVLVVLAEPDGGALVKRAFRGTKIGLHGLDSSDPPQVLLVSDYGKDRLLHDSLSGPTETSILKSIDLLGVTPFAELNSHRSVEQFFSMGVPTVLVLHSSTAEGATLAEHRRVLTGTRDALRSALFPDSRLRYTFASVDVGPRPGLAAMYGVDAGCRQVDPAGRLCGVVIEDTPNLKRYRCDFPPVAAADGADPKKGSTEGGPRFLADFAQTVKTCLQQFEKGQLTPYQFSETISPDQDGRVFNSLKLTADNFADIVNAPERDRDLVVIFYAQYDSMSLAMLPLFGRMSLAYAKAFDEELRSPDTIEGAPIPLFGRFNVELNALPNDLVISSTPSIVLFPAPAAGEASTASPIWIHPPVGSDGKPAEAASAPGTGHDDNDEPFHMELIRRLRKVSPGAAKLADADLLDTMPKAEMAAKGGASAVKKSEADL